MLIMRGHYVWKMCGRNIIYSLLGALAARTKLKLDLFYYFHVKPCSKYGVICMETSCRSPDLLFQQKRMLLTMTFKCRGFCSEIRVPQILTLPIAIILSSAD